MKIKKNVAISDSGFIYNPDNGESFSANAFGIEVLNLLKEGVEYADIKRSVLDKYQTDEDTFEKDYNDFLFSLKQYQILENEE
ncbi:PqqD family protein [Bacteroidota bacterium]